MKKSADHKPDKDQLKELFPHHSGFITPDRYFDQLTSEILEKAKHEKQNSGKSISTTRIYLTLAAAACITVFLAIYFQIRTTQKPVLTDSNKIENAVDASYVNDLFTEDYQQTETLIEELGDNDISFIEKSDDDDDITEESIIEYLNDQEIDLTLLAEL